VHPLILPSQQQVQPWSTVTLAVPHRLAGIEKEAHNTLSASGAAKHCCCALLSLKLSATADPQFKLRDVSEVTED
jgi:hypothetical protein